MTTLRFSERDKKLIEVEAQTDAERLEERFRERCEHAGIGRTRADDLLRSESGGGPLVNPLGEDYGKMSQIWRELCNAYSDEAVGWKIYRTPTPVGTRQFNEYVRSRASLRGRIQEV